VKKIAGQKKLMARKLSIAVGKAALKQHEKNADMTELNITSNTN
jgi:hypothetical protein